MERQTYTRKELFILSNYANIEQMQMWFYHKILMTLIGICIHVIPQLERVGGNEATKIEVNNCLKKLTELKDKIDEFRSDCKSDDVRIILHTMIANNTTEIVNSTVFLFGPNLEMQLLACNFTPDAQTNFLKFVENCVNFYDAKTHATTHTTTPPPSFSVFDTLNRLRFPPKANFSHRILELQHKVCEEDSIDILVKLHMSVRIFIDRMFGHTLTLRALAESAYSEADKKNFVEAKNELLTRLRMDGIAPQAILKFVQANSFYLLQNMQIQPMLVM